MTLVISSSTPANDDVQVVLNTSITIVLSSSNTVIPSTIDVTIRGVAAIVDGLFQAGFTGSITPGTPAAMTTIIISQSTSFNSYEIVEVEVVASDATDTLSTSFSFLTLDVNAPVFVDLTPAHQSIDNSTNTPIFFRVQDQGDGYGNGQSGVARTILATKTNGSSVLTNVETVVGLVAGTSVRGLGIPTNTTIFSISPPSTITLSNPVTISAVDSQVIFVNLNVTVNSANAVLGGLIQSGFGGAVTPVGTSIDVYLTRDTEYDSGETITVTASATDQDNTTTLLIGGNPYEFTIVDLQPPLITNQIPAPNATNIGETTTIALVVSDPNGSGIDSSSINIRVNGTAAVTNGVGNVVFGSVSFIPMSGTILIVMSPASSFASSSTVTVHVSVKDIHGNTTTTAYNFYVRDFAAPQIDNRRPDDNEVDILPSTNIAFTLIEDGYSYVDGYPDGYGINFQTLEIFVDGSSVYSGEFDGYSIQEGYGAFTQPTVRDGYGNLIYRGYKTTIAPIGLNKYDVVVDPLVDFDFSTLVVVSIDIQDYGAHATSETYSFTTAAEGQLITTATPDTGTYTNFIDGYGLQESYKFLTETGVVLTTNLPNTITYYTVDGSLPQVNRYGQVMGTTKVYTRPILIQREGLNVLKFLSADSAGNLESVRQEVYMIKLLPPAERVDLAIKIVADIPLKTTVIPIEFHSLFHEGDAIRVLDDVRPPVLTTILTVNRTSNPPFLIVKDPVERLRINKNARVELLPRPISKAASIALDVRQLPEFMYIGSDGHGTNQADAVLEQFRILNVASTNEEILADFTLLQKGTKFFNQDETVELTSEYSALEKQRANLPDSTLVLLDFDGTVLNNPRQGVLKSNTVAVLDKYRAGNRANFLISVKRGVFVDRELLTTVLKNFAPVDLDIEVTFIEVD